MNLRKKKSFCLIVFHNLKKEFIYHLFPGKHCLGRSSEDPAVKSRPVQEKKITHSTITWQVTQKQPGVSNRETALPHGLPTGCLITAQHGATAQRHGHRKAAGSPPRHPDRWFHCISQVRGLLEKSADGHMPTSFPRPIFYLSLPYASVKILQNLGIDQQVLLSSDCA